MASRMFSVCFYMGLNLDTYGLTEEYNCIYTS